jgi:hypothetical protein
MVCSQQQRQWEGWGGYGWMWGVPELWWYGLAKVFAYNAEVDFYREDATQFWVKGRVKEGEKEGLFGVTFPWNAPLQKGFVYKFILRMAPPDCLPDFIVVNESVVWKREQGYAEYPRVEFEYVPERDNEEAQIFLVKICRLSEPSWKSQVQPPQASWDSKAKVGKLSNGLLTVMTDGKTTTLALPSGEALFSGLHFYGYIDEQGRPVPLGKTPKDLNLQPINTTMFQSLEGSVLSEADRNKIQLVKECATGVLVTETLVLHSNLPLFEYRLQIKNQRQRLIYLVDYDGIIHARFGNAMVGVKQLILPTGVARRLGAQWSSVSEQNLPEGHRTWMVVQVEEGNAIGIINLSENMHSWAFTKDAFWLYQFGKRPVEIAPDESVSFGVAFLVLSPEDAVEGTLAAFRSLDKFEFPRNFKLQLRKWFTLHPPHQSYWHPDNLRCLRARYDGARPSYEKFSLPDGTQFFSIEPTIACRMLDEFATQPVEYKRPPLSKKLPYANDDIVLIEGIIPIDEAGLASSNGIDAYFHYAPGRSIAEVESMEWAKRLRDAGIKKLAIHPFWVEGERYRGAHWIDAINAGKLEETKEAVIWLAKKWLSFVPDSEVIIYYPEVNSCYGHWGRGIKDAPIARIPGYEDIRQGGTQAWELCFKFFQELARELKGNIGGKVKLLFHFDRAAFQGAYAAHSGADIIMHKNIHRQSINIVVANSRGAARAYGKEYGFDFDCWDRQYWHSYHPDGVLQDLLVYFHSGAGYILNEIPVWAKGGVTKLGEAWLDFCRYARTHPKRGEQQVRIAIMRALGDEWNRVAGPSASWEAGRWLPLDLAQEGRKVEETYLWDYVLLNLVFANYGLPWRTFPDRLCTGTPYGPVDFIPWDTPLEKLRGYEVVIFLGSGAIDLSTYKNLEAYVRGGGKLVMAVGQLRGADGEFVTKDVMGIKLGEKREIDGKRYTYLQLSSSATQQVVYRLRNSDPMVVRCRYGSGELFLFSGEWLTYFDDRVPTNLLAKLLEGAKLLEFEPYSDWLEYMVQRRGKVYIFPIFNHGRGFFPSGNGVDYGAWEGVVRVDLAKLGLKLKDLAVYRLVYQPERQIPFSLEPVKFTVEEDKMSFRLRVEKFEEVVIGPRTECLGLLGKKGK